jgi:hypothetical protein
MIATLHELPVNTNRPWSEQELTLLTHYQNSLAITEALLNQIDRTPEAIRVKLKRMNQPAIPRRYWTNTELKFLAEHVNQPLTWLASQLQRSVGSIQTQLSRQEETP